MAGGRAGGQAVGTLKWPAKGRFASHLTHHRFTGLSLATACWQPDISGPTVREVLRMKSIKLGRHWKPALVLF